MSRKPKKILMKNICCYLIILLFSIFGCQWDLDKIEVEGDGGNGISTTLSVNFDVNNNNCLTPCDPAFSNTSENADSFLWKFGDGTTSEMENPAHTYSEAGDYEVTLIGSNDTEVDSITKTIKIMSLEPILPIANFSIDNNGCLVPCDAELINISQNATSYEWELGNNELSTDENPPFIFDIPGDYDIRLVAFNGFGSDTVTKTVNIAAPITFEKAFGEANSKEIGGAVVQMDNEDYAFGGGNPLSGYFVRTDKYGESPEEISKPFDFVISFDRTFDGGFIYTGFNAENNYFTFMQKTSGLFANDDATTLNGQSDFIFYAKEIVANNYLACGRTNTPNGTQGTIFQIDENFNITNTTIFEDYYSILQVVPSTAGDLIFLCSNALGDLFLCRADLGSSTLTWEYPLPNEFNLEDRFEESDQLLIEDTNGALLIIGNMGNDAVLLEVDAAGSGSMSYTFGGTGNDGFASISKASDGGYIMVGKTNSIGNGGLDVYLVKLNNSKELTWERTFGGVVDDLGSSVKPTIDNGYIIVGSTKSMGNIGSNNLENVYLIKTDYLGRVY